MRYLYIFIFLLTGGLVVLFIVNINSPSQKSALCSGQVITAASQLVHEDFDQFLKFFVEARNNIVCDPGESMANVALQVEKNQGEHYYGIFHIHFSPVTGALNSEGSEIRWKYNWKPLKDGTEWKTDWCAFILKSYRYETKKQKCQ